MFTDFPSAWGRTTESVIMSGDYQTVDSILTKSDYFRRLLNYGAYVGWIQHLLVQVTKGTFREEGLYLVE